ncbi:hypothetical protein EG329_010395 [Mollisiaceae sp. DMI_Dod_QoI]|nr:hypothetical protein EG329_010395 [Helotiales sp. DMI_Dod_QoI]
MGSSWDKLAEEARALGSHPDPDPDPDPNPNPNPNPNSFEPPEIAVLLEVEVGANTTGGEDGDGLILHGLGPGHYSPFLDQLYSDLQGILHRCCGVPVLQRSWIGCWIPAQHTKRILTYNTRLKTEAHAKD